jgi:hypothetical protein
MKNAEINRPHAWNGNQLAGEWLLTAKIDGVRTIWHDEQGWQRRANKPLYNIPPWQPGRPRDCEVFLGTFRDTIQATRTKFVKGDTPVIRPEHIYGLEPLDPRLRWGSLTNPNPATSLPSSNAPTTLAMRVWSFVSTIIGSKLSQKKRTTWLSPGTTRVRGSTSADWGSSQQIRATSVAASRTPSAKSYGPKPRLDDLSGKSSKSAASNLHGPINSVIRSLYACALTNLSLKTTELRHIKSNTGLTMRTQLSHWQAQILSMHPSRYAQQKNIITIRNPHGRRRRRRIPGRDLA